MKYLKNKELLIVIIIYLFVAIFFLMNNTKLYTDVINPLFWACILAYLIWNIKNGYIRFCRNNKQLKYMIIILCIYTVFYFCLGFIFGFTKNPYNHDVLSILKNIIIQILPVISIEIARNVILNRNKNNKLLPAFVTLTLILVEINYNTLFNLFINKEEFFKYICEAILPLIAFSSLYTYLTLKGSPTLPLVYRLFQKSIILFFPLLPDLDWFIVASINILLPTIIYVLFKYKFTNERKDIRKKQENISARISYLLTITFVVTLVCFMLGLFRYQPISILSSSMVPTFSRGDVVIYEKLGDSEPEKITIGSVIIYHVGEQYVAHRVVNIIHENGSVLYQTKGDSNNAPDMNLVQLSQIQGIYAFHIKYLGFPSIWLYDYFNHENAVVQTK